MKIQEKLKLNIPFSTVGILILATIFLLNIQNTAFAWDKFLEVGPTMTNYEQPVAINQNEVFFPGGYIAKNKNKSKILSAKILNIKTKKLKDLNTTMNCPRSLYGVIKYDDDNILIIGGERYDNKSKRLKYNTVENYNISENKFTELEDLPMSFNYANAGKPILLNEYVYIITDEGIMRFNIKSRHFQVLKKFSERFAFGTVTAMALDENNILIWGGHYKEGPLHSIEDNYFANISRYNILNNKITELVSIKQPSWKNPISKFGTPIDDNTIVFFTGNKNRGTIYVYDVKNNSFNSHGNTKFGARGASGIYLNTGKILLVGGIIDDGNEPFTEPKYMNCAILNLHTKKLSKIKKVKTNKVRLLRLTNNRIFIGKIGIGKPMVYVYAAEEE